MTEDIKLLSRCGQSVETALQAIRDEKVDAVIGTDHLIMLRLREVEQQLRLSEARYRGIVESQTEMICRWSPDRRLTFVNEAYCRFYGRSREELIGKKVPLFVHPEDAESVNRYMEALILDRSPREIEHRISVGRNVYWISWYDQTIVDDHGRLMEIQSVGRDITDRVRAENALREANQELSEFAYALTHNMKAPMRAVSNYAQFLHEDLAGILEGEPKKYLENLRKAITLSNRYFDELLVLYNIENDLRKSEALEMGCLIKEIREALQLSPNHTLTAAQQWPALQCQRHLMRQILLNLISNGFKFNRAGKKHVEVGWQPAGDGHIEMFVRDNGIGIAPQFHAQIFKIFRRLHTEREYDGIGIGLSVVRKAVKKMGGAVRVESALGKGSTFYVNLPLDS
ncbi:MAG: ATP-binding protein [Desulfobacterales bacterium]